jgi:hypothetical protein
LAEITDAARAVDAAAAARVRAQELESDESADGPGVLAEIEALRDQADRLTSLLAPYARTITRTLEDTSAVRERD